MHYKHIVFDWGDTLMRDDRSQKSAMYLWREVHAIDGAKRVVQELSRAFVISVATSAAQSDEEMVRKALRRVELDRYVSNVFTGRTIGKKKTDPAFWTQIQRELKAEAKEVLIVGDSFESDVLAPVEAGLTAIWLNVGSQLKRTGDGYSTINTLTELIEIAKQPPGGDA